MVFKLYSASEPKKKRGGKHRRNLRPVLRLQLPLFFFFQGESEDDEQIKKKRAFIALALLSGKKRRLFCFCFIYGEAQPFLNTLKLYVDLLFFGSCCYL